MDNSWPALSSPAIQDIARASRPKDPDWGSANQGFGGRPFHHTDMQFQVRGQIFLNLPPATGPVYVHVSIPNDAPGVAPMSAGGGPLSPNGEFDVNAWAASEPELLRLSFSDERGTFHVRDLPAEQLMAPVSLSSDVALEELSIEVLSERNQPIEGVHIRIYAKRIGPGSSWSDALTDDAGSVSFLLPSGPVEYYVSKPDLRFAHGQFHWDTDGDRMPKTLVLERLRAQDQVSGRLVDSLGAPVHGALVSVGPQTPLASKIMASTRSDAQGNFSLMVAGNEPMELTASHRDIGQTQPLLLHGDKQHLRIAFPAPDDGSNPSGAFLKGK